MFGPQRERRCPMPTNLLGVWEDTPPTSVNGTVATRGRTLMQIETILPIWADLRRYRREWLAHDLLAGLGIAAIAMPIGIA